MPEQFELLRNFVSYRTRGMQNLRRVERRLRAMDRSLISINRRLDQLAQRAGRLNARGFDRAARQMRSIARDSGVAARNTARIGVGGFGGGGGGRGGGRGGGGGRRARIPGFIGFGGLGATVAGLAGFTGGLTLVDQAADAVRVASSFQQIELSLRAIVGDEAKFTRLLDRLRALSLRTSTNFFTDLVPSAQLLLASGFDTERIPVLLEQLADLQILSGSSLGSLAELVGRNKLQFRSLTRDVREFTNQGINVIPSLARQLGVASAEAVLKGAEDGKVNILNLEQAITDLVSKGGPAFRLQAQAIGTFAQEAEKLSETFTQLKQEVGEDVLPFLTRQVQALQSALEGPSAATRSRANIRDTPRFGGTGRASRATRTGLAFLTTPLRFLTSQIPGATAREFGLALDRRLGLQPAESTARPSLAVIRRQQQDRFREQRGLPNQEGTVAAAATAVVSTVTAEVISRVTQSSAAAQSLLRQRDAIEKAFLAGLDPFNRGVSELSRALDVLNRSVLSLTTSLDLGDVFRVENEDIN